MSARSHRPAAALFSVLATAVLAPVPARGWGAAGHEIVCEIAFQELDGRPAQAEIRRLIALDPRFDTFAAACDGPDDPRQRAAEHFANLPRRTREIVAPVCRLGVPCLLSALEQDVRELARPEIPDARRLEWADSTPIDWADESFALLRRREVDYCTRKQGSCWHDLDREFYRPG